MPGKRAFVTQKRPPLTFSHDGHPDYFEEPLIIQSVPESTGSSPGQMQLFHQGVLEHLRKVDPSRLRPVIQP